MIVDNWKYLSVGLGVILSLPLSSYIGGSMIVTSIGVSVFKSIGCLMGGTIGYIGGKKMINQYNFNNDLYKYYDDNFSYDNKNLSKEIREIDTIMINKILNKEDLSDIFKKLMDTYEHPFKEIYCDLLDLFLDKYRNIPNRSAEIIRDSNEILEILCLVFRKIYLKNVEYRYYDVLDIYNLKEKFDKEDENNKKIFICKTFIKKYLFEDIDSYVGSVLKFSFKKEEEYFINKMDEYKNKDISEIDIISNLDSICLDLDLDEYKKIMDKLLKSNNDIEKLLIFEEIYENISREYFLKKNKMIGLTELIPLLLYIIIKCNLKYFFMEVRYLELMYDGNLIGKNDFLVMLIRSVSSLFFENYYEI